MSSFATSLMLLTASAANVGEMPDPSSVVQNLTDELENQDTSNLISIFENVEKCDALVNTNHQDIGSLTNGWVREYSDDIGTIFSTDRFVIMYSSNDPTSDLKSCTIVTRTDLDAGFIVQQFSQKYKFSASDIDKDHQPFPNLRWLIDTGKTKYFLGTTLHPTSGFGIVVARQKQEQN